MMVPRGQKQKRSELPTEKHSIRLRRAFYLCAYCAYGWSLMTYRWNIRTIRYEPYTISQLKHAMAIGCDVEAASPNILRRPWGRRARIPCGASLGQPHAE